MHLKFELQFYFLVLFLSAVLLHSTTNMYHLWFVHCGHQKFTSQATWCQQSPRFGALIYSILYLGILTIDRTKSRFNLFLCLKRKQ